MLLKRLIPESLRRQFGWVLHLILGIPRAFLILIRSTSKPNAIQVFYGFDSIPNIHEPIHGGLVKFQRMQDEFPNSPERFNVLYMVSSRMPFGGAQMAWAANKKGAKLVWNQNGVAYPAWCPVGWKQINNTLAKVHRRADYVFYQSDFCRKSAAEFLGVRHGPSEILYNAVDTEIFKPLPNKTMTGPFTLLLGGTQYQWYRLQVALAALAIILQRGLHAKLLVSGRLCWHADESRTYREAYIEMVRLGIADYVEFLGPYSQKEAPAIINRADILLHPKVNDPCPGLVVEAMACGVPVIFSKSGGVPELVGSDAGIGIELEGEWYEDNPPSPESIANAVCNLANERTTFAVAARNRAVALFDLRPWMARHQKIFSEVLQ